jgi:hypothetical protein
VVEVVIPAWNAAATLRAAVEAVVPGAGRDRVLVVDAGSDDDTGAVARDCGVRVLRLDARVGPAAARNAGVAATRGEIVLFVDADCVAHPDAVERVRAAFAGDPSLSALSGSYDDAPPATGFFSQYMNLRHHATHQLARPGLAMFWAGCGAVRRSAILAAGGFDAARYPTPQIEDIELGLRLERLGGRLRLDPALQVTHRKAWTLRTVVRTDVLQRAAPWSELILDGADLPRDLNLRPSQRAAAALAAPALAAVAALLAAVGVAVAGASGARAAAVAATAAAVIVASVAVNRDLLALLARKRGIWFAARAWLFHQVHLLYSAATFAVCWLRRPRSQRALRGVRSS